MVHHIKPLKFSALLATLLLFSCLTAQDAAKTYDESFSNPGDVGITQSRGPLTILPATDGKIRVVTEMSVEGKNGTDAAAFLIKLQTEVKEMGGRLLVETGLRNVRSWNQNNNSMKIVFQDGTKFSGIRNFELSTTVYLPETQRLKIETRFERVDVDPTVKIGNLELVLNNSKYRGGSISGSLKLSVRFGELEIGDIGGNLTGTMHNVRTEFGNVGDVRLDTRFCRQRMGTVKTLELTSHNDHLEVKSVLGEVEIDDRFGTYTIGSTGNGRISTHNGTFEIESGGEYKVMGRFGNFDFDRIDVLELRDNHNSDYDVKELGSVSGDGRFTNVVADHLGQSADLNLENGKLRVDEVAPGFRGISVEGRFFEVDINFRKPTNYRVFANLRFGDLRVPDNLVTVKKIKDHSDLEVELKTSNASNNSAMIKVKGQNAKLFID
ncbi:hypothetical protein [Neolewinella persica]|uniref:hypothetical protein n=1 Tax=Neolewinella persica TaxID=70998 RepID=UPI0003A8904A|nr:hypothetical protein [Neolewinella persica]